MDTEKDNIAGAFTQSHATQLILKLFEISKESVEELVDVLPVVYCVATAKGEVVRGNKDLGKILNSPFERLIGRNLRALFSEEGWESITRAIQEALSKGAHREVMVPIQWNNQKLYYIWSFVRLSRLPTLDLVTVIGQDITEAELGLRRVKRLNELLDRLIVTSQNMMDSENVNSCVSTSLEALMASIPTDLANHVDISFSLPNRIEPIAGSLARSSSIKRAGVSTQLQIEWGGNQVGVISVDSPRLEDRELLKFIHLLGQSTYLSLSHLSFQVEMEDKVAQGTLKIAQLNAGLSALLNSLSEGYAVFDLDGVFQQTSSRRMREFCGGDFVGKKFGQVFKLEPSIASQFQDWLGVIKKKALPFEDLARLCPVSWFYPEGTGLKISLSFHPIRDDENQVEKVALVATDRTAQLSAESRAADESDKSFMVLRILEDILGFEECWAMLSDFVNDLETQEHSKEERVRAAHSLKSEFSYFGLEPVSRLLNEFETEYSKGGFNGFESWLQTFRTKMSDFMGQYPQIFNYMTSAQAQRLSSSGDTRLIELLNSTDNVSELRGRMADQLLFQPLNLLLEPTFKRFYARAKSVGIHVGLQSSGLEAKVWASHYRSFFISLEHLFNNIVDHGFKGKNNPSFTGKVTVKAVDGPKELTLFIADNGSGIDLERLLVKAKDSGIKMTPQLEANPLNLIFVPGLSTTDQANMYSGRGVGMEVVAHELNLIKGSINVKSVWGSGTEFEVKLPKVAPQLK